MFRQAPDSQQIPTRVDRLHSHWWRLSPLAFFAIATGCAPIPRLPEEPTPEPPVEAIANQTPTEVPEAPTQEQSHADTIAPDPATAARRVKPTQPRILVLRSSDAENYLEVAAALSEQLSDQYALHAINLSDPGIREATSRTDPSAWNAVVAIGEDAAEFAAIELDVPTVFCQIFDYAPLLQEYDHLFGVEPLPPLKLQLQSWRQISPDVQSVGLIVSNDQEALVAEAREVAAELGLELRASFAVTDQDAIYQFKRFAQSVDGLWLYPSRQILSPNSIREMLDYALTHQVQTIVFNESLLDWGALLSVGSNTNDVATAAAALLDELIRDSGVNGTRMRPLTAVDSHLNPATARALGIAGPATSEPVQQLLTTLENDN